MNIKQELIALVAGYDERSVWKWKTRCRNTNNVILKAYCLRRYNRLLLQFGAYIGYNAVLADIPTLPHSLFGIFITDSAQIGMGCVIFHHVTIGSNTLRDSKSFGAPTIGNNCYIGAGAKIIGNVKIGDNVRIGANCVVSKDIPSNHTVVLQAPRLIPCENIDNTFIRIKSFQNYPSKDSTR